MLETSRSSIMGRATLNVICGNHFSCFREMATVSEEIDSKTRGLVWMNSSTCDGLYEFCVKFRKTNEMNYQNE